MAAEREHLAAVGRLEADPGSPWVGLARIGGRYELAFGAPDGRIHVVAGTSRRELLALAIAYVDESLIDPPPELEATHADLADLVSWLHGTATTADEAALLRLALDGIDDGLAADVVIARLAAAADSDLRRTPNEQVDDWVDLLAERYRSVSGG